MTITGPSKMRSTPQSMGYYIGEIKNPGADSDVNYSMSAIVY